MNKKKTTFVVKFILIELCLRKHVQLARDIKLNQLFSYTDEHYKTMISFYIFSD